MKPTHYNHLTHPAKNTGRIIKDICTDATCFVCTALRSDFTLNTSSQKRKGGHTRIHKHQIPYRKRGDKKSDQTVSLSLYSTNHSNSLFMLDMYSAPSSPVSSIKHSFISLHPFVQFGHIILCSGITPIAIYKPV